VKKAVSKSSVYDVLVQLASSCCSKPEQVHLTRVHSGCFSKLMVSGFVRVEGFEESSLLGKDLHTMPALNSLYPEIHCALV
jgi:hypothetical protein